MCKPVQCNVCGKTTWSGCGAHVDQVMSKVKEEDRCKCNEPIASPKNDASRTPKKTPIKK